MAKMGLGKGLGSLIPSIKREISLSDKVDAHSDEGTDRILEIDPEKIQVNPHQPRVEFDPHEMEELKDSIEEYGLLQPLVVQKTGEDSYELIAGERRLRAVKALNFVTVPVVVREATGREKLELALIENIQRSNLNPMEEAMAYQQLQEEYGMTHDEIAKRLGKSRTVVSNTIRLAQLPLEIQSALRTGQISMSHGRMLAGIADNNEKMNLFRTILSQSLSIQGAEHEARKVIVKSHIRKKRFDPLLQDYEERLRVRLGTKVSITKNKNGGSVVIDFYSDEELRNIIKNIVE